MIVLLSICCIFAVELDCFWFVKPSPPRDRPIDGIMTDIKTTVKHWLPLTGLTFSTFIFNTTEFIPIGLLSDIASDFGITEAHAGLLISVYAWFVALLSLPLMLLVAKMDYRRLMLSVVALFVASHIFSSLSQSFGMLMVSRICVACSHSIFWSIVSPIAVKIAPEGKSSAALGMIVTGSSIAMILGLPMGRVIGLHLGWRVTFLCIAAAAFAVLVFLAFVFPKVKNSNTITLHSLPTLLKNPALICIYIITATFITGHFTGYSYIEPFLSQVAGFSEQLVTFTLMAFGVSGMLGSVIFSRYFDRTPRTFITFALIGVTVFMMLLHLSAASHLASISICMLWGIAITAYNLVFQSEVIRVAPEGTTIAMSIYSGIYNVGIACGALTGGAVCSYLSITWVGYVGGTITLLVALIGLRQLLRRLYPQGFFKKQNKNNTKNLAK